MTEYWRRTATEIADLVRSRKISASDVTRDALDRIEAVNPALNAIVQDCGEEALSAAEAIDRRIAEGHDPGLLAGVPVTTKVNIDQKGFATTNGLRIQKDLVAEHDNPVTANLRRAGAVIVGRTNTPAFSLRWFCRNSLHGTTRNPWDPALTPGGSSGGAASAVAAGIGAIGHGTDIGGSIRYPAYACGIHGIRPTLGRVPAANFTAPDRQIGAQLMAVSGPIARSISDLRLGLAAMSAADPGDPWWVPAPLALPPVPKRATLCIRPEGLAVAPEIETALRRAADLLAAAGWQIREAPCPPLREPARLQALLWLAETRRGNNRAIAEEDDPDANFVYNQMEALCPAPDINDLLDALQRRLGLLREWQMFFEETPLLICPVSGELPFPDQDDVTSPERFAQIMEAQLTQLGLPLMGLPGLTVSTGITAKGPVGVQLIAGRYREDILLDAGEIIEAAGTPQTPIDPQHQNPSPQA
ncbi:MAG: amidase family protein [Pseudomonadota bacterium]